MKIKILPKVKPQTDDDICSNELQTNYEKIKERKNISDVKTDNNRFFQRKKNAASDVFYTADCENSNNDKKIKDTPVITCDICDFYGKKQSDYNRHINSKKHKQKCGIEPRHLKNHECDYCKKEYVKYSSYWSHIQKCKEFPHASMVDECETSPVHTIPLNTVEQTPIMPINDEFKNNIINKLFLENRELRNFVVEQSKEHTKTTKKIINKIVNMNKNNSVSNELVTHNNNNNNINNTNNNTINGNVTSNNVNINLFLNDKCKDAVNLTEFIDNVQITNADLENNANSGFVNGISKILIDNLKNLSIYDRPIHCTDVKRETMYIKEDKNWSKEDDDKKMKNAIQEISRKIMVQFSQWREDNPDYVDLDSEAGMKYVAITQNSVAGSKRDAYYGKIMKSIAKETVIPH